MRASYLSALRRRVRRDPYAAGVDKRLAFSSGFISSCIAKPYRQLGIMELRHLRYFAALAEKLHFTRAAEQVHVTQSTLSHQIRQLEDELGRQLFDRVGKRVFLTQDGQLFLASVAQSLAALDAGLKNLKEPSAALAAEVRIGATAALAEVFVPQCLAAYLQGAPSARLNVEILTPEEIGRALIEERLDIGVAYPPLETAGLWSEPLFEERMRVLVRKNHPYAKRRSLRLVDLHGQKMVFGARRYSFRQMLEGYFRAAGAEPQVLVEGTGNFSTLRMLIAAIDIAAVLPESACPADAALRAIPLQGPAPVLMPSIYLKEDRPQSVAAKTLIELLKQAGFRRMQSRRARRS